ncbi:hypothetical protein [Streptomyces sp. H27-C3]|uniref:hypothetical protein n=1 Tax=Streptomyces sp. H27-C3 TaxID=3046305 RepID=UPI0024BACFD8|nr:hypothetical protein [Streptomyces sp. H27-C3]MDJ0460545.1 hypothetical protein [Streptomyces sp. H27-C3]
MSTAPAHEPRDPESGHKPAQEPEPAQKSEPGHKPRPKPTLDFGDPMDQQSSDDTDRGWGERPSAGGSAADLARFLDEKPPHHL